MLVYVTSIAVGIYDERRQLVIAEATAIESSYTFSAVSDKPTGDLARQELRECVIQRLSVSDLQEVFAAAIRSDQLLDQLGAMP